MAGGSDPPALGPRVCGLSAASREPTAAGPAVRRRDLRAKEAWRLRGLDFQTDPRPPPAPSQWVKAVGERSALALGSVSPSSRP